MTVQQLAFEYEYRFDWIVASAWLRLTRVRLQPTGHPRSFLGPVKVSVSAPMSEWVAAFDAISRKSELTSKSGLNVRPNEDWSRVLLQRGYDEEERDVVEVPRDRIAEVVRLGMQTMTRRARLNPTTRTILLRLLTLIREDLVTGLTFTMGEPGRDGVDLGRHPLVEKCDELIQALTNHDPTPRKE